MPRERRWEPNDRLAYERERRGWSQDDAAREAERLPTGLASQTWSSPGRSSAAGSGASAGRGRRFVA
jgi:hypothetical protein